MVKELSNTVFFLRKQHTLSIDELITLKLCETRYLQLAEYMSTFSVEKMYMLIQYSLQFLYYSGKPLMIRVLVEPITPMIDVRDGGVICQVVAHDDSMVRRTHNKSDNDL